MAHNEPWLNEKLAEKTYKAIGQFMFEFSQTEYSIRTCLGLEIKLNMELFSAVVQSYDVATLCSVLMKVIKITRPNEAEEIEAQINKFMKLNDQRVRVAHGLWFPHVQGGMIHHVSRSSREAKMYPDQAESLEKLADEARVMRRDLMNLFIGVHPLFMDK